MNSSSDDLGLRIALCDLIERLKRCEQKCSYLERCRHELIKEVVRLRSQNQLMATHLDSIHFINNNNQLLVGPVDDLKIDCKDRSADEDYDLNGSDCDKEENWQQITIRLLHNLKREISANDDNQLIRFDEQDLRLNGDETIDTISTNDMLNTVTTNDTILTINDSLSPIDDKKIQNKSNYDMNDKQLKKLVISMNEMTNDSNLSPHLSVQHIDSSLMSSKSDHKLKNAAKNFNNSNNNNINHLMNSTTHEMNSLDMKATTNSSSFMSTNNDMDTNNNNNNESIKAFLSTISVVKQELNDVLMTLNSQNERLTRLKAKQLRNYFNRQIHLDLTNTQQQQQQQSSRTDGNSNTSKRQPINNNRQKQ